MNAARTRFGIIRHAPTLWNEEKLIQGQQDSPLSLRGKSMAEAWGRELLACRWDLLLCSDLDRALQTAALINLSLHLQIVRDKRLREQDWGDWTGKKLRELEMLHRGMVKEQEQKGWDFRPPGGESRLEVLTRSLAALAEAHAAEKGRNIMVVCHEGVMKCLLYHLLGRRFMPDEPKVIQGFHLHMTAMEGETFSLEKLNSLSLTSIPVDTEGS